MRYAVLLFLAFFASVSSVQAEKTKVFLNGSPITGVRDQLFKNVSVKIDGQGNVHILGKQYSIKAKAKKMAQKMPSTIKGKIVVPPRVEVGPAPKQKYVLLVQRSAANASGYALKVKINGRLALRVPLTTEQDVINLTPFLKKGDNAVTIESSKMKADVPGTLTVKVYPGRIVGGQVRIKDKVKINYVRKGDEKDNFRHIIKTYIP